MEGRGCPSSRALKKFPAIAGVRRSPPTRPLHGPRRKIFVSSRRVAAVMSRCQIPPLPSAPLGAGEEVVHRRPLRMPATQTEQDRPLAQVAHRTGRTHLGEQPLPRPARGLRVRPVLPVRHRSQRSSQRSGTAPPRGHALPPPPRERGARQCLPPPRHPGGWGWGWADRRFVPRSASASKANRSPARRGTARAGSRAQPSLTPTPL